MAPKKSAVTDLLGEDAAKSTEPDDMEDDMDEAEGDDDRVDAMSELMKALKGSSPETALEAWDYLQSVSEG